MPAYDDALPTWQRELNTFCENWLYAFLVAMVVTQFVVQAFRIPTTSMEPMLYGDPGILKGDQVVVDKVSPRFTGYHRWDVTVFQFPRPELEFGDDARPAISSSGERMDDPLTQPLFGRNFVKRLLALPGDTFYFAGGDLHLRQPDGTWAIARKPASVQEALWHEIYHQGEQEGYLPWSASGASTVTADGDGLRLGLAEGPVAFTQPLRNLYVKPGSVYVRPMNGGEGEVVPVSMTSPLFTWHGQKGNLWDLDSWRIQRITARDLDAAHGSELNRVMDEFVGDVRFEAVVRSLEGSAVLHLGQGAIHDYALELAANGWVLRGDGAEMARGNDAPAGAPLRYAHVDGELVLDIAGREVCRKAVPEADPAVHRLRLWWSGRGSVALSGVLLRRDQHYCAKGVLTNGDVEWMSAESQLRSEDPVVADRAAETQRLLALVRQQMRGDAPKDGRPDLRRHGVSPETAITVPPGSYLLMGDNSPFSWDSRWWGYVPGSNLRGRALVVMFPPNRWRVVR